MTATERAASSTWDLLDSAPDAMIVVDAAGSITFVNTQTERLFGYSRSEITGKPFETLLPANVRSQYGQHLAAYFSGTSARAIEGDLELAGLRKSGYAFPVDIALSSVEHGSATMAVVAVRDISARKEAEAAERRSLREVERMHGQLDCAPITVVRLDRHSRITHVNEAWRKFARESGADTWVIEGVGLDYIEITRGMCDECAKIVASALPELAAGRKTSFTCVYPCHSSTEVRWFRLDARKLADDDAIVLIHTNITEQYLAEARLRVQSVVTEILAERTPLPDSCHRIMRTTCEELDWDLAKTWMLGDGAQARCTASWTRSGGNVPASDQTLPLSSEIVQGLPGRVWASGSVEWIQDLSVDPNFLRDPHPVATRFQSGFAIPFVCEGEVFAVLEFFSHIRRGPDSALLELLGTSGAQLGARALRERAEQRAGWAEAAQRSIRGMLDAILECAPAGIVALDRLGRIQFINRVLPHRKKEDAIGADWLQHVSPDKHEAQRERLRLVVEMGVPQTYETMVVGPDGEKMWFSTRMGPMREGDRIVGAVLATQEVTELKRTQMGLAAAERLAAVGTLAAGVAHEINTPIQFVNDSVHFLRDAAKDVFVFVEKLQVVRRLAATGAPATELREAIHAADEGEEEVDLEYLHENVPTAFERCLDGLERVSIIVRSMKEFSHRDRGEMAPTDINRAINNTLALTRNEYKYVADLKVDLDELPPVTCYVNDISQMVLNLVVNAAHAIEDVVKGSNTKGTIEVRTRQVGEHVIISVSDTGGGIPDAIAQHIFEPFFTTKEVGKGTGQGLALAWSVVNEKHGGELSFKTRIGEGTTFFVRLPIDRKTSGQLSGV